MTVPKPPKARPVQLPVDVEPLWLTPKPAVLAAVTVLKATFTPQDQSGLAPGAFPGEDGTWVWAEVSTKYPARQRPPRFVKVSRVGGGQDDPVTDKARVLVECFARSTAEAEAMTGTARAGFRNACSTWITPDGGPEMFLRWYGNETGLADIAHPDIFDYERFQFLAELWIAVNR